MCVCVCVCDEIWRRDISQSGKGSSLGQAPALPGNIRLGWKGLPGTNTLTYYGKA